MVTSALQLQHFLMAEREEQLTSERKAVANRRNSRKSTGPKTKGGKAAVRSNALKHGLTRQAAVLPGENETEYAGMKAGIVEELRPVGPLQTILVDRIASTIWRLQRCTRIECGVLERGYLEAIAEMANQEARSYERPQKEGWSEETVGMLMSRIVPVADEARHEDALTRAEEAWGRLRAETPTLGSAFVRDARESQALLILSRYETSLDRCLSRQLRELRKLQGARYEASSDTAHAT